MWGGVGCDVAAWILCLLPIVVKLAGPVFGHVVVGLGELVAGLRRKYDFGGVLFDHLRHMVEAAATVPVKSHTAYEVLGSAQCQG